VVRLARMDCQRQPPLISRRPAAQLRRRTLASAEARPQTESRSVDALNSSSGVRRGVFRSRLVRTCPWVRSIRVDRAPLGVAHRIDRKVRFHADALVHAQQTLTESCIVRRFDRISRPDGTLGRVVQYDVCQLVGTISDRKYEKEGGPGIARCAELIRQYSSQPAVDLRNFIRWLFFNLFVGNNDSHAKNLSLYSMPGKGVALTPFYDLMCTRLHPGLSPDFAFAIGGEAKPGSMTRDHFTALAKELAMRPQFVLAQGLELAERLPNAMTKAMEQIQPSLPNAAKALASRLEMFVQSTTKKLATRMKAKPSM